MGVIAEPAEGHDEMTELLARSAQILVALSGAYLVALWFVLIVWTYRDIESRSRNVVTQVLSTTLSVLFFVPGVLLYMILRPKDTLDQTFQRSLEEEYLLQDLEELPLCPSCHHAVEDDYRLCPHCHARLREPCLACHRLVDMRWRICPYCAAPQRDAVAAPAADTVEALPGRWMAPGVPRRRRVVPMPAPYRPVAEVSPLEVAATIAETAPSLAPLQLPASLRSFARPFDRWRHAEATHEEPSSELSAVTSSSAVSANTPPAVRSTTPGGVGLSTPRGRFRPVAVIPESSPEPSNSEGEAGRPDSIASRNGDGGATGPSGTKPEDIERPSIAGDAEAVRRELVKTSSD